MTSDWEDEYQRRLGVVFNEERPNDTGVPPFTVSSETYTWNSGCDTCGASGTETSICITDARGCSATIAYEYDDAFTMLMRRLAAVE